MTTIELFGGPRDGLLMEIPLDVEDAGFPGSLQMHAFGPADWDALVAAAEQGTHEVVYVREETDEPRTNLRYLWEGLSG